MVFQSTAPGSLCLMGYLPGLLDRFLLDLTRYIDGLMQDCIISSALAMEILQSWCKPPIFSAQYDSWNYIHSRSNSVPANGLTLTGNQFICSGHVNLRRQSVNITSAINISDTAYTPTEAPTNMDWLQSQHEVLKLFVHSRTSTVQPVMFG